MTSSHSLSTAAAHPLAAFIVAAALIGAVPASGQVKGDLTGDGVVDQADIVRLIGIASGKLSPADAGEEARADVGPMVAGEGGDGVVDIGDASVAVQVLRGEDPDLDGLDLDRENAIGTSPFSEDTDADTFRDSVDTQPLYAQPGLQVETTATQITLTWDALVAGAREYIVHRYAQDGSENYEFYRVDGAVTSYVDTSAQAGVVYVYRIQAVAHDRTITETFTCSATLPGEDAPWVPGKLGPISNPFFIAVSDGTTTLQVFWQSSTAPGLAGYRVYLSSTPVLPGVTTGLTQVADVADPLATESVVPGMAPGTYYVRLTAYDASNESDLASARQQVVEFF